METECPGCIDCGPPMVRKAEDRCGPKPDLGPYVGSTYRHFRGVTYLVEAVGSHTEGGGTMVVYREVGPRGAFGPTWVRPIESWDEPTPEGNLRFQILP